MEKSPKLRTVEKYKPPYPLNKFPKRFPIDLGREIVYFTWQPHGSQFTIIEDVPNERLAIRIKKPPLVDRDEILKAMKFDESWIEIIK